MESLEMQFRIPNCSSYLVSGFSLVLERLYYSSTVTSYFTAPKLMQVANSLDDVAHGYPQNVKLLVEKDGFMAEQYLVTYKPNVYEYLYE